jgi:PDZ domain-containing secreted protein
MHMTIYQYRWLFCSFLVTCVLVDNVLEVCTVSIYILEEGGNMYLRNVGNIASNTQEQNLHQNFTTVRAKNQKKSRYISF